MNLEINNARKKWYSFIPVKFNLVEAMRDREVVLMDRTDNSKCIRSIWIKSIDYLTYILNAFNFFERDYNIYVSVAKYRYIPDFTFNLKERSSQTSVWFENESYLNIFSYDMLLDFDLKKIDEFSDFLKEIKKVINILNSNGCYYNIYPSGNNFQIVINGESFSYLTQRYSKDLFRSPLKKNLNLCSRNYYIKTITESFRRVFGLKYLDTNGIGNHNKLRKCEYSLVQNKVVLPLNNPESDLKNFNYSNMTVSNILKTTQLKYRGLCYQNNSTKKPSRTERFVRGNFLV